MTKSSKKKSIIQKKIDEYNKFNANTGGLLYPNQNSLWVREALLEVQAEARYERNQWIGKQLLSYYENHVETDELKAKWFVKLTKQLADILVEIPKQ